MNDCIFCKIIAGEIPSKKAYEDDDILAFYDISPQAPLHVLIIPKKHLASLDDIDEIDDNITAKLLRVAAQIARVNNIDKQGYRVVTNIGEHGAQSVKHLHLHVLGGRQLSAEIC